MVRPTLQTYWLRNREAKMIDQAQYLWNRSNREEAIKNLPCAMRRGLVALINDDFPVRKRYKKGSQKSRKCPLCEENDEGHCGVFLCTEQSTILRWTKNITDFCEWMQDNETSPMLTNCIMYYLQSWHNPNLRRLCPARNRAISKALENQAMIGWDFFLFGRHSNEFEVIQASYLSKKKSSKTGKGWAIGFITKCLEFTWDMWRHRKEIINTAANANLDEDIRAQFALNSASFPIEDLQKVLSRPYKWKSEWLHKTKLSQQKAKDGKDQPGRQLSSQRRCMYRWLNVKASAVPAPKPQLLRKNEKRKASSLSVPVVQPSISKFLRPRKKTTR